jgi:hypothetical protein
MSIPSSQAELDQGYTELKSEPERMNDEIERCKAKVDSIEWPSGWERAGQLLLTAVFPVAGFYFAYQDLERIIASQPAVRDALNEASQKIGEVLILIGNLSSPGNPFAMKEMANQWDGVNNILTGAVGGLADAQFVATTSWTDDMGQRYANVPAGQRAALEGLIPHINNMRTFLRDHSTEILKLWWELINIVVQWVIDAIPLASKFITGNPLKWVELAQPIADAVAHVLQLIQDIAQRIGQFVFDSAAQIESFRGAASDATGTDFGAWPRAQIS